jgi:hypothetical protein
MPKLPKAENSKLTLEHSRNSNYSVSTHHTTHNRQDSRETLLLQYILKLSLCSHTSLSVTSETITHITCRTAAWIYSASILNAF